ncbi:MAG: CHAT domain-containing protein [Roseiflexaceae bacterium]|nr:CHAT domain-containing protein [Roseiflexaceae bacterium]
MPIDFNVLKLNTEFIIVTADTMVGAAYALMPKETREKLAFSYVLAALPDGRYFAARWVEIEEIGRRFGAGQLRAIKLTDIAALPAPTTPPLPGGYPKLAEYSFADLLRLLTPAEAVEKSQTTTQEARQIRDSNPGKRIVILDNGTVVGLIILEMLSGDTVGNDPFKRGGAVLNIPDGPVTDRSAGDTITALPSADTPTTGAVTASIAAATPAAKRVFNYWLNALDEQGNGTPLTPTTPLQKGRVYELKINLAKPNDRSFAQSSAAGVDEAEAGMAPEREFYDILIVLSTSDFTLYGSTEQTLTVWRGSFSKNAVSFAFESVNDLKDGNGTISAHFFIDGRCFQEIQFNLRVGGKASRDPALTINEIRGKSLASIMRQAANAVAPAADSSPINLVIIKEAAGYKFILGGAGVTRATLNLSEAQIAEQIGKARNTLLQIVDTLANGEAIYQSEVTNIPEAVHKSSLKALAAQGFLLFQRLFYGAGMGPDAKAMGDLLKKISKERKLHIEIIAERFIFPWSILFVGDPRAATIDPQDFWGFRHVIEYMPEFSVATPVNFAPEIRVGAKLPMTFVANTHIDDQLLQNSYPAVIAPQMTFFNKLDTVDVQQITTTDEFFTLLSNPDAPPLIYINCHAVSNQVGEKGGVYDSMLQLTDKTISIDDLDLFAPPFDGGLKNGPLVFINACQSAELSPYMYAGLVPAMIQRGARGVIGTEVNTPALFAAEFAQTFIERFSKGNTPIGQLLLDLRTEYLTTKNNIMPLLYALYSSGELVVKR